MKVVQAILLVAGMGCFGYGAWRLVDEIVFRATSVPVRGVVVASLDRLETQTTWSNDERSHRDEKVTVSYPVVRFRSPRDGRLYRAVSTREVRDGEEPGVAVELRASTREAKDGRAPHFSWRVLLPLGLFLGGLLAILLIVVAFRMTSPQGLVEGESLLPVLRPAVIFVALAVVPVVLRWTLPQLSQKTLGYLLFSGAALAEVMRAEPPPEGQLPSGAELRIGGMAVYGRRAATAAVTQAIEEGRHEDLRRYLRAAKDPGLRFPVDLSRIAPLGQAVSRRDAEAVRILFEAGVEAQQEPGVLEAAVWSGREDLLRLLAAHGVQPENAAAAKELVECVLTARDDAMLPALLELGWVEGEPFPPDQLGLLDRALLRGLVRSAAELERRGFATQSPLLARLVQGDLAGMRAAAPEGEWVAQRLAGAPLLSFAAQAGQLAVVRRLVELGADPAIAAGIDRGPERSALDLAAERGHLEVVRYLARLPGARGWFEPADREAPVILAAAARRWEVVQALVEAGASPNGSNRREPPLHLAAREGNGAAVEYLLAHGADPLAEGAEMMLPVEVATDPAVRAAIERAGGSGP